MTVHDTTPVTSTPSDLFEKALYRVLRPFVRLLLNQKYTYPRLIHLLKTAYVDVAESDFPVEGKKQTVSRISLITGVHRKDVKQLMDDPHALTTRHVVVPLAASVIAAWMGRKKYLNANGKPKILPRHSHRKSEISFDTLAINITTDLPPRSVLDELLNQNVVTLLDNDLIKLNVEAFVPNKNDEEKIGFFERNTHDYLATVAHNLSGDSPPFLERAAFYQGLSEESAQELESLSEKVGMKALRTVNKKAQDLVERQGNIKEKRRISFGIYFYREDQK